MVIVMTNKEKEKMYECETECPRAELEKDNDDICTDCEVLCYYMDIKSVTCYEKHKDNSFNKDNIKKRFTEYIDTLPIDAQITLNVSVEYQRPIKKLKKIYRGIKKLKEQKLPL